MIELFKNFKKDATLVSGFPGIGKSYLFNNPTEFKNILDSDSSTFDKRGFPQNYIAHIKSNLKKVDLILISSHKEVRDALISENLKFNLVYPDIKLKNDYLTRYIDRGSPQSFIELLNSNWETWITELMEINSDLVNHIVLEKGEFLGSVLNQLK